MDTGGVVRYGVGIDLGTTFTSAAVSDEAGARMVSLSAEFVVPSLVYQAPDGTLLTGVAAREAAASPDRVGRGFKRRIGDPTPLLLGGSAFAPTALMAAQLRDVLDQVTRSMGGAPASVVLTCPAVWGPYRREQFAEVPRLAGLEDVRLITEPEAAALHYSRERTLGEGEVVAVYDLGGGTLDTTVLRMRDDGMEILGTPEGIEHMGGMDFDDALLSYLDARLDGAITGLDPADPAATRALATIRELCVSTKIELSAEPDVTLTVPLPSGSRELTITRREFNTVIRPSVELTVSALRRTVASAGLGVEELSAVLLAGGSSRIPLVTQLVSERFGKPVRVAQHPKFTVALGAATAADTRAPSSVTTVKPAAKPAPAPTTAEPEAKPATRPKPDRRLLIVSAAAVTVLALVTAVVLAVNYPGVEPNGMDPLLASDEGSAPSTPPPPAAQPLMLFDNDLVEPYRGFIHSKEDKGRSKEIVRGSASQEVIEVRTGDGLHVRWKGGSPGQVYLQSVNLFRDLSVYGDGGGELAFDMQVNNPPDGQTAVGAQCGRECAGTFDTTRMFQDLRAGEQRSVVVPLSCFVRRGLDTTRVEVPFWMNSTGSFDVVLRNIRWTSNAADGSAGTQCPAP